MTDQSQVRPYEKGDDVMRRKPKFHKNQVVCTKKGSWPYRVLSSKFDGDSYVYLLLTPQSGAVGGFRESSLRPLTPMERERETPNG